MDSKETGNSEATTTAATAVAATATVVAAKSTTPENSNSQKASPSQNMPAGAEEAAKNDDFVAPCTPNQNDNETEESATSESGPQPKSASDYFGTLAGADKATEAVAEASKAPDQHGKKVHETDEAEQQQLRGNVITMAAATAHSGQRRGRKSNAQNTAAAAATLAQQAAGYRRLSAVLAAGPLSSTVLNDMAEVLHTVDKTEVLWKEMFAHVVNLRTTQHGVPAGAAPASLTILTELASSSEHLPVSSPEIVENWLEQQQWVYEYFCEQFEESVTLTTTPAPSRNVRSMFAKLELLRMLNVKFVRSPPASSSLLSQKNPPPKSASLVGSRMASGAATPANVTRIKPAAALGEEWAGDPEQVHPLETNTAPTTVHEQAPSLVDGATAGIGASLPGAPAGSATFPAGDTDVSFLPTAGTPAATAPSASVMMALGSTYLTALKTAMAAASKDSSVQTPTAAAGASTTVTTTEETASPDKQVKKVGLSEEEWRADILQRKEERKRKRREREAAAREAAKAETRKKVSEAWDARLEEVREYRDQHGHCDEMPAKLQTWVITQRRRLNGTEGGRLRPLTAEQERRMRDVGITVLRKKKVDKIKKEAIEEAKKKQGTLSAVPEISDAVAKKLAATENFDAMYEEMKKFYEEHGTTVIPDKFPKLRTWLVHLRKEYKQVKAGTPSIILTPERIARLEQINFSFEARVKHTFTEHFNQWLAYRQQHGKDPTISHKIGAWVVKTRGRYHDTIEGKPPMGNGPNLTEEQIDMLRRNGFPFGERNPDRIVRSWDYHYKKLVEYYEANGHSKVPQRDPELGDWVHKQRRYHTEGRLKPERQAKLEQVEFVWLTRNRPTKKRAAPDDDEDSSLPTTTKKRKSKAAPPPRDNDDSENDDEVQHASPPGPPHMAYHDAHYQHDYAPLPAAGGAAPPLPHQQGIFPPQWQQAMGRRWL